MNIQNISVKNLNIDYSNEKFKHIINSNKHLLPNLNKQSVSFEIINSNEAFANAIRRVFNDELPVKCLDTSYHNVSTNDKFILIDNIIERINLVSILQNIDINTTFNINVTNDTNDIINIYTKDLINKNKTDKTIYFNNNIQICSLRPNRYLNINNIKPNIDYGYNNCIYSIGSFKYKAINTDFNIASLNNDVSDYLIELINNSNISIKDLINLIHETLYFRLKKIQDYVNNYNIEKNSDDFNKLNDEIYILKNNNIKNTNITLEVDNNIEENILDNINNLYEIYIKNECHTVGNLLTKYIFLQLPTIEHIQYRLHHPLTRKLIISIKHSNYKKIFNDAINSILKDLDIFKSSFK
jgi:DNA-directed RNA polymerase subunit L